MLDQIKSTIIKTLVETADIPREVIDFDQPVEQIGIKSADAVYLCGVLEEAFDLELDPALIFEADTLGQFAQEAAALAQTAP